MASDRSEPVEIEAHLMSYLDKREPMTRYTSFDYCFNYFQSHREQGKLPDLLEGDALQLSCLHVGFYLASWGMLRGSSELLQRSVRTFIPLVNAIANAPAAIWEMDAHLYGDGSCPVVFETARRIEAALPDGASDILVTKVMLGTFGCVPAFDTYFKKGFAVSTFGRKALRKPESSTPRTPRSSTGTESTLWSSILVQRASEDTRGRR